MKQVSKVSTCRVRKPGSEHQLVRRARVSMTPKSRVRISRKKVCKLRRSKDKDNVKAVFDGFFIHHNGWGSGKLNCITFQIIYLHHDILYSSSACTSIRETQRVIERTRANLLAIYARAPERFFSIAHNHFIIVLQSCLGLDACCYLAEQLQVGRESRK